MLAIVSALLGFVSLGVFWSVLFAAPTRTPLLILSCDYSSPWDLNAWRVANVGAIEALNRRNLNVKQLGDANELIMGRWDEFDDAIAQLDYFAPKEKPLLLYVNLHGLVDPNREPCLLLSDSSVLDTQSWLPLQTLIDHISETLKNDRDVVLFLESSRQLDPLPRENGENLFASAIGRLVDSNGASGRVKSLSVFLSSLATVPFTNPEEEFHDPFTHFLSRALAGDCDAKQNGGNNSRSVELNEIERYVFERTQELALTQQSVPPSPRLFTNQQSALTVSWAITRRAQKTLTEKKYKSGTATDSVQLQSEIETAWRTVAALHANAPWHNKPAEWMKLVRNTVDLESAVFGGRDSVKRTDHWKDNIQRLANDLRQASTPEFSRSQSIPIDLHIAQNAQEVWSQFSESPSLQTAMKLTNSSLPAEVEAAHTAVPFLTLAAQQINSPIWRTTTPLQKYAAAQSRLESIRQQWLPLSYLNLVARYESELSRQSRSIADRMLLGQVEDDLIADIDSFSNLVDIVDRWTSWLTNSMRAHEQAISEIPTLCIACDLLDSLSSEPTTLLSGHFEQIVEAIINNMLFIEEASLSPVDDLTSKLFKNLTQTSTTAERTAVDVSAELSTLRRKLSHRWRELFQSQSCEDTRKVLALEWLLRSGFLPTEGEPLEKAVQLRIGTRKFLAHIGHRETKANQSSLDPSPSSTRCQVAVGKLIAAIRSTSLTSQDHIGNTPLRHATESRPFITALLEDGLLSDSRCSPARAVLLARLTASLTLDTRCDQMIDQWESMQAKKRLVRGCHRFMEDFWHEPMIGSQSYFQAVSTRLLADAASIASEHASPQLQQAILALKTKKEVVANLATLKVSSIPIWDVESDVIVKCEITPNRNIGGLPPGIASLNIASMHSSKNVPMSCCTPEAVVVGPTMNQQTVELQVPTEQVLAQSAESFVASVRFRGHLLEQAFDVVSNLKNIIVAKFSEDGPASILLTDQRSKQRARTIVLDCSASMNAPNPLEGPSPAGLSTGAASSKLTAARLAVAEILGRWKGSSDPVGLMLFGHRLAVGDPSQSLLIQQRYHAKFPFSQSIQPFEDVETILPVGRFADEEYSAVLNRLDQLLPWGQTPLYLAIHQAIEQSGLLGTDQSLDVIVISDGKNYQFNATTDKNVSLEAVIELAQRKHVRIHVIGFGIPESDLAEATGQYHRLAHESGGTVTMDVANAASLVRKIESIVEPETYTIQFPSGESLSGECGQRLSVTSHLVTNTPVELTYRNQRQLIPISPQSAIQLNVGSDEQLVSATFDDEGEPHRVPILNTDRSASPFVLGVHRPHSRDSKLIWNLSLQRTDGAVAQRPKFVWTEVTPISERGATLNLSNQSYFIPDTSWKAATPIPVLQFETQNWPTDATKGSLQFWCTDIEPQVLDEIELNLDQAMVLAKTKSAQSGTSMGTQVRYQVFVDQDSAAIVLFDDRDGSNLHDIAPLLECGAALQHIERQYRLAQRMSVHRFAFLPTGESNPWWLSARVAKFRLISTADIKKKGLQLAMPVEIPLLKELVTLPRTLQPILQR